jgi:hypothetical protein
VVSVGLEHVERFVLDLPAREAARGDFGDVAGVDVEIGEEAVVIGPFACAVQDFDGDPGNGRMRVRRIENRWSRRADLAIFARCSLLLK